MAPSQYVMLLSSLLLNTAYSPLTAGVTFQAPPRALISPDWPPPRHLSQSSAIQAAIVHFQDAVTAGFNGSTPTGQPIDSQTTSWSVELYSANEDGPIYTRHYNAPGLADPKEGVKQVDSNTIYRVGSISKLMTVYMYLINEGLTSWNDPVSKYTPEFAAYQKEHQDAIDAGTPGIWDFDSITVGSVASQLAGFPREAAGSADIDNSYLATGIPFIEPFPTNYTDAGCPNVGKDYDSPCTRSALLGNLLAQSPAQPAFYAPIYSNIAYGILGIIIEDITGRNITTIFEEDLVQGLGLNSTYYRNAPVSQGIIPFNHTFSAYTFDINSLAPAGNYFSSVNDFRKMGQSILSSTKLAPSVTRQWLKPIAFVSNPKQAVGGPWEIYEAPLTPKQSWMYTKSGSIGLYQSYMILLPDWDAGITILCAGVDTGYSILRFLADTMTKIFVPALEKAAQEEAASTYAGVYYDTPSNSTVTVTDGGDGPGLEITQWIINGTNILSILSELNYQSENTSARLYPSGLESRERKGGLVQLTYVLYNVNATWDDEPFSYYGAEWFGLYGQPYRGTTASQWIFELDEQGERAVSVTPKFLNTTLTRQC